MLALMTRACAGTRIQVLVILGSRALLRSTPVDAAEFSGESTLSPETTSAVVLQIARCVEGYAFGYKERDASRQKQGRRFKHCVCTIGLEYNCLAGAAQVKR